MPSPIPALLAVMAVAAAAALAPSVAAPPVPRTTAPTRTPNAWRSRAPLSSPFESARPPARPADRVVLVSIDGLRPDAIDSANMVLGRLASQGIAARQARTIDRSATLPSHASMLSGVGVARHGIAFNSWRPERGRIRFPSIFHRTRAAGLATSLFVGKRKLEHILLPGDADVFAMGGINCRRVTALALEHLASAPPGLHFVHYADVDSAGHRDGWMSDPYRRAVRQVDACLGELLEGIHRAGNLDRTLVLVTADHGGHDRLHGSSSHEDTQIPWIAWGRGVRAGARPDGVDTRDTAATILAALGIPRPAELEGSPVLDAVRRR